jgi:lysophospholipase L1-like esterase
MTSKTAAGDSSASAERRPVIALGDSHTRGFYGASWLRVLRPQFPHLKFINAGHDGEPSHSIAARLPALLKANPDPAAVLIFAGSNDCIAQESEDLQWYYKRMFRLPELCSEQTALQNVEKMVEMAQQQAPKAKVCSWVFLFLLFLASTCLQA